MHILISQNRAFNKRPSQVVGIFLTLLLATACSGSDGTPGVTGPQGATGATGSTGPSGSGVLFSSATGTATLVTDTLVLTYTQVPGLSASVTVPASSSYKVFVETDGGVQINSIDQSAFCFADIALFVDGAQIGAARRVTVTNSAQVLYSVVGYGFSAQTVLASGTHTVSVQAKKIPMSFYECYVSSGAGGTVLPGNPKLQGNLNVIAFP
ncbi:MAG: hypothetical protein ABJB66_08400 [Gemmatimonadaceae bacterium]